LVARYYAQNATNTIAYGVKPMNNELTPQELAFVNGETESTGIPGSNHFTEAEGRNIDPDYIHSSQNGTEVSQMATLRTEAEQYQPKQTLNIADLEKIPLSLELKDGEGETKEGEKFTYKYAVVDGQEYRVAGTIIAGIKALIEKMPDLEFVQVIKTGIGRETRYQVIPYQAPITTAQAIAPQQQ